MLLLGLFLAVAGLPTTNLPDKLEERVLRCAWTDNCCTQYVKTLPWYHEQSALYRDDPMVISRLSSPNEHVFSCIDTREDIPDDESRSIGHFYLVCNEGSFPVFTKHWIDNAWQKKLWCVPHAHHLIGTTKSVGVPSLCFTAYVPHDIEREAVLLIWTTTTNTHTYSSGESKLAAFISVDPIKSLFAPHQKNYTVTSTTYDSLWKMPDERMVICARAARTGLEDEGTSTIEYAKMLVHAAMMRPYSEHHVSIINNSMTRPADHAYGTLRHNPDPSSDQLTRISGEIYQPNLPRYISSPDIMVQAESAVDDTLGDLPNGKVKQRKTNRQASINAENHKGFRIAKANKRAFLSDEAIGKSKTFRIFMVLFYWVNQFFHRITVEGHEFEPGKNCLSIHMHTTHNQDIPYGILATYRRYGLVTRGLVHRTVMAMSPILGYIGLVPGFRDTAVELMTQGFLVSVIPGGAEEALRGHENAYTLDWPKERRGFAKVAIRAQTPIVPVFYENAEEMRFNPIFFLWNLIHGSVPYDAIVKRKIPYVSGPLQTIAEMIWYTLASLFSIPMPCKVTIHLGEPIEVNADSDVDEVVKESYEALQALIDKWQPGRKKSYWRAFKQWKDDVVADNYRWKDIPRCEAYWKDRK